MPEEEQKAPQAPSSSSGKNIGMAVLCYFGILVLIPLLTEAKNEAFVKFHIKQGLVLLISYVIVSIITAVPILGWVVGGILWLVLAVLFIVGIINVVGGKETELPIIGKYAEKINI